MYQNEKIRPPILGAYELFICPSNLSTPFPFHAVYCHQEIRIWPPSVANFLCTTITSKEMTIRIFLYFFTCHRCLNILLNTFKCTGKSSSICMIARDDNDELEGAFVTQPYVLHSIKFQNVCLCMSMYMWELFTRVFSRTLHFP